MLASPSPDSLGQRSISLQRSLDFLILVPGAERIRVCQVGASAQGGGCRQPEDPADARILGRRFPPMYQLHGEPHPPRRLEAGVGGSG